ncbi:lysostaphin resistance A-like protein [Neobacillus sp. SAB-20_R2A]|uniref:CPBP family intramembrane glutamic endopeptidase n=1 Tax=Neobacillus sp. SAB-20_R2A TaxID=3120519 RepID=UPI003C6DBD28
MELKRTLDLRLITGLIIAHALLFFSFHDKAIFWYIFSGSILILIAFSTFQGDVEDEATFIKYLFLGVISGLLLYLLFWIGYQLFEMANSGFKKDVRRLYRWFAPSLFWHYLALILVAAPGEEMFWRGFVQKRLLKYLKPYVAIISSSILYGSVHIYSGSFLLMFAAFVSGLVWGFLYFWKKSMPLVIVSHIIFDMMMFIFLPLT